MNGIFEYSLKIPIIHYDLKLYGSWDNWKSPIIVGTSSHLSNKHILLHFDKLKDYQYKWYLNGNWFLSNYGKVIINDIWNANHIINVSDIREFGRSKICKHCSHITCECPWNDYIN